MSDRWSLGLCAIALELGGGWEAALIREVHLDI